MNKQLSIKCTLPQRKAPTLMPLELLVTNVLLLYVEHSQLTIKLTTI